MFRELAVRLRSVAVNRDGFVQGIDEQWLIVQSDNMKL